MSAVSKLLDSSLASRNAAGEFAIGGAIEQAHLNLLASVADSLLAQSLMQNAAAARARRLEKFLAPMLEKAKETFSKTFAPDDGVRVETEVDADGNMAESYILPADWVIELLAAGSDAIATLDPGSISRKRLEAAQERLRGCFVVSDRSESEEVPS